MAIPDKFMQIAIQFQRAMRTGDFNEVDKIPVDDLKLAKAYLVPDRNIEYYQILLEKLEEKKLEQNVKRVTLNILNSNVGLINTGKIEHVESIATNISLLTQFGHTEVANGLNELAKSVCSSRNLSEEQKTESLEIIKELSGQAALPENKRTGKGVMKALLNNLKSTISISADLVQLWSTFGPKIADFLGISGPFNV